MHRGLIERAAYTKKIARLPRIAYDEWNVWLRTDDGALEERYTFDDALAVGTYLNIFVRNCRWFRMANLAATTTTDRGRLAVPLVNRSPGQPEIADIVLRDLEFDGPARFRTVTAERDRADRLLRDVETVHVEQGAVPSRGQAISIRLPPRSFTVIEAAAASA